MQLLTTKMVAERLSIEEQTVRQLCQRHQRGESGGIPAIKIGRGWRINEKDLEVFVSESKARRS